MTDAPPPGVEQLLFKQWLKDSMTVKFFEAVQREALDVLSKAAKFAMDSGTSPGHVREHNNLIKARALLKLIEDYADPNQYPYPSTHKRPASSGQPTG
jgi:hypothetical protein